MKGIIERLLRSKGAREIIKSIVMETLSERGVSGGKPSGERKPRRQWRRNVADWQVIPDEADGEEYLNTTQTAKLLGVAMPQISTMRDSGLLRAYRRAGCRRPLYRREDVLALRRAREEMGTSPKRLC